MVLITIFDEELINRFVECSINPWLPVGGRLCRIFFVFNKERVGPLGQLEIPLKMGSLRKPKFYYNMHAFYKEPVN